MTFYTMESLDSPLVYGVETPKDPRKLVFVVRGLPKRAFSVTVDATADIHFLKWYIEIMIGKSIGYHVPGFDVLGATAHTLDVFSTKQFPGGWARLDKDDNINDIDDPESLVPLLGKRKVGHYFPSDIPAADARVAHIVAEVSMRPLVSVSPRSTVTSLPDDKPVPNEDTDQMYARYRRVQEALGLCVSWCIDGTDFSKLHDYQGAQWLQHQRYPGERHSRVFIGDKPTWRDLYIACDEAVQTLEGRVGDRYVEYFTLLKDGTLELGFGT